MGGGACTVIIIEGNLAYALVNRFADDNFKINTYFLESAIQASCAGINYVSLYFGGYRNEDKVSSEYTQPIIDLHNEIIEKLSSTDKNTSQAQVDKFAIDLFTATRKLYELYGEVPSDLVDLHKLLRLHYTHDERSK